MSTWQAKRIAQMIDAAMNRKSEIDRLKAIKKAAQRVIDYNRRMHYPWPHEELDYLEELLENEHPRS